MAKQNIYPLQQQAVYSANGVSRLNLPESGYTSHLDLLLTITVTTAGTTVLQDAAFHLLKSLRIKAAGSKTFLDFSDGRQLKYYNWYQYRGQCEEPTIPAAAVLGVYRYLIPIHLGMNPMDEFDPTVVVPAVRLQDLVMEIGWGGPADIGAPGVANLSATIDTSIHEIALSPGEKESSVWPKGLLSPRFEPKIYTNLALAANLGMTHDLAVGDVLNRVVGLMFDAADVRSNLDLTAVGFKLPKQRETPFERNWYSQNYHDRMMHDYSASQDGAYILYGSEISGRPVGLDLTNAVTGDAQLAFTVGVAAGSLHLVQVMYQ